MKALNVIELYTLILYFICVLPQLKYFYINIHTHTHTHIYIKNFPGGSDGKASAYSAGDLGSIPGSGRSSGEGNGNPLQYSCLENPMGGGA